jgi:hypothetical protein
MNSGPVKPNPASRLSREHRDAAVRTSRKRAFLLDGRPGALSVIGLSLSGQMATV